MSQSQPGDNVKGVQRVAPLFDLTGIVAVVTGGRGNLGSAFLDALSYAGARVASIDRKPVPSATNAARMEYQADITSKEQVTAVYERIATDLGTPSVLINCAGVDSPPQHSPETTGWFEDFSEASWDLIVDSHLKGALFMSQEFIRRIRSEQIPHASIINISSIYGVVSPDQSMYDFLRNDGTTFFKPVAYSVAKAGMLNFSRWLAEYGAPFGIRANALVLGGVFNNQPQAFLDAYASRSPLGRLANREEYNGAIVFLASHKASSYMTGFVMVVDGGWTAR